MTSERAAPSIGRRIARMLWAAAGWILTAVGVVAIVVLAGDPSLGGTTRTVVLVSAIFAVLAPAVVGVAYRLLRARNRRREAQPGAAPLSERAVRGQDLLGAAALRLQTDHRQGVGRAVLGDRVRISQSTVRDIPSSELLEFLWVTRPSQPDGFPRSPEFEGLPQNVQDMIVLLDLRRRVELRGAEVARKATSGFYHHDQERTAAAVRRSGNPRLRAEYFALAPRTEGLLAALDDPLTWDGVSRA